MRPRTGTGVQLARSALVDSVKRTGTLAGRRARTTTAPSGSVSWRVSNSAAGSRVAAGASARGAAPSPSWTQTDCCRPSCLHAHLQRAARRPAAGGRGVQRQRGQRRRLPARRGVGTRRRGQRERAPAGPGIEDAQVRRIARSAAAPARRRAGPRAPALLPAGVQGGAPARRRRAPASAAVPASAAAASSAGQCQAQAVMAWPPCSRGSRRGGCAARRRQRREPAHHQHQQAHGDEHHDALGAAAVGQVDDEQLEHRQAQQAGAQHPRRAQRAPVRSHHQHQRDQRPQDRVAGLHQEGGEQRPAHPTARRRSGAPRAARPC